MAAPKGNTYYLLRESDGVPKTFSNPSDLWAAFKSYIETVQSNPWLKNEAIKGGDLAGTCVEIPTEKPFTLSGFAIFCGITLRALQNYGNMESYKDFFPIYKLIEDVVYNQKFEGAACGVFNASIIARDLGLADKAETNNEHHITITRRIVGNADNK